MCAGICIMLHFIMSANWQTDKSFKAHIALLSAIALQGYQCKNSVQFCHFFLWIFTVIIFKSWNTCFSSQEMSTPNWHVWYIKFTRMQTRHQIIILKVQNWCYKCIWLMHITTAFTLKLSHFKLVSKRFYWTNNK